MLYRQVSAGEGQQERTEITQIRTDRRRKQGLQDASEQDPDQSGSPREGARKIGKLNKAEQSRPEPNGSICLDLGPNPKSQGSGPRPSADLSDEQKILKLPPTHPAEAKELCRATLTVRQCACNSSRNIFAYTYHTHTHNTPRPLAPGRSDTGADRSGSNPGSDRQREKHQRPPRRTTSTRICPIPKLTVSVSSD